MAENNPNNSALLAMFAAKKAEKAAAKAAKRGATNRRRTQLEDAIAASSGPVPVENRSAVLYQLIMNGKYEELQHFFNNNDTDPNMIMDIGSHPGPYSLLFLALHNYTTNPDVYLNIIRLLLERGANPNTIDKNRHPLLVAIRYGSDELVNLLLEKGADPNASETIEDPMNENNLEGPETTTTTAIQEAIATHNFNLVTRLLSNPVVIYPINRLQSDIFTFSQNNYDNHNFFVMYDTLLPLLVIAIAKKNQELFELCIQRGANVNMELDNGFTPLLIAARHGRLEMVQQLLANGADPLFQMEGGYTLGYFAQASGNQDLIDFLVAQDIHFPGTAEGDPTFIQEPTPQEKPILNTPEYTIYESRTIPTNRIPQLDPNTEVFDTLMASDSTLDTILEDEDNLIFRYGHKHGVNAPSDYKYFAYPRSSIIDSLRRNENLRYKCKREMEGAPRINNISYPFPAYFIISGPQSFMIPLSHIVGWIDNPEVRIFDIIDTGKQIDVMTSWHSIQEGYEGRGLRGQQINIRSSEHCNPGTSHREYKLAILNMGESTDGHESAQAEGGRRRRRRHHTAHKKRLIPRRIQTRKQRHHITRRKRQVKKAHKSHKRH